MNTKVEKERGQVLNLECSMVNKVIKAGMGSQDSRLDPDNPLGSVAVSHE